MAKNGASRRVTVDVDNITFGVEIECVLPDYFITGKNIQIGPYHHGLALPAPFPAGWVAMRDGSVRTEKVGYTPVEIVSPILKGKDGLQAILRVFEVLTAANVEVNDTCGFHVHIGVESVLGEKAMDDGIVVRWVRRMLNLVSNHELGLLAITGRISRMGNQYCQSVMQKWNGKLTTHSPLKKITAETDTHMDRYYTLNLCNLRAGTRTVEFRVFGATTDGLQAIGYVITAMGLAHRAAAVGTAPKFCSTTTAISPVEATLALHKLLQQWGWASGVKSAFGQRVAAAQLQAAQEFTQALIASKQPQRSFLGESNNG